MSAPRRIYLVLGEDDATYPVGGANGDEVTWCAESQYASDVAYVRADLHDALAERADKLHKALREFAIYPAGFIGGSFNGNAMGCRLCKARFWRHGEREHHALECLARPVAPPTDTP